MVWSAWKTVVLAAGAACLAACGGGSSTGSGGAGTGGDTGTSSGTDTSSSSSGTGTSTDTSTEPFEGIRCLIDGVAHEWPQGGLDNTTEMYVGLEKTGNLTFWGYPQSPPPEIRVFIKDGNTPGTYPCGLETHVWYFTADFGWTTVENDCTITLTESAQTLNAYWVGTFTATIPPFTDGSKPPIVVTEGTFNVRRRQ